MAAAFGQSAVTFVSQNYGVGNIKRCKKIFWLCMLFGFGFTEILSVIFMIWGNFLISICTISSAVASYGDNQQERSGIISTMKEKSSGSGLYKPLLNFCEIDDQIAVIDPHRDLIIESIRMRLITFFKEIAQE